MLIEVLDFIFVEYTDPIIGCLWRNWDIWQYIYLTIDLTDQFAKKLNVLIAIAMELYDKEMNYD